jgi:precorrin-6B methylase 1
MLKKIYVVGISPHPSLITCKARELIEKAPAVIVLDTDYPFDLSGLLKGKKVVKLTPGFRAQENREEVLRRNRELVLGLDVDWAVWLEIGTPSVRNPVERHLLGEIPPGLEVEFVPGVSSVTAVLDRLRVIARHLCVFGGEETERIGKAVEACDLFVIIHLKDREAIDLLKSRGYKVVFVEECCTEREKVTREFSGRTYWTIAVAYKDGSVFLGGKEPFSAEGNDSGA